MTIRSWKNYPANQAYVGEPGLNCNAEVGERVRQLAHDLRQPVAAIRALAAAGAAEVGAGEPIVRRLAQISDQASWISAAIDDALESRDSVRTAPARQPVSIRALIRAVVDTEQLSYPGRITFSDSSSSDRCVIACATRLRRAIANVLANATRAAGTAGEVGVYEAAHGGLEIVEVTDSGPGFGGLDNEHGIGLQVTRSVLAETGGWLEIESPPGGPTLVRLNLPVAEMLPRAGTQCA